MRRVCRFLFSFQIVNRRPNRAPFAGHIWRFRTVLLSNAGVSFPFDAHYFWGNPQNEGVPFGFPLKPPKKRAPPEKRKQKKRKRGQIGRKKKKEGKKPVETGGQKRFAFCTDGPMDLQGFLRPESRRKGRRSRAPRARASAAPGARAFRPPAGGSRGILLVEKMWLSSEKEEEKKVLVE